MIAKLTEEEKKGVVQVVGEFKYLKKYVKPFLGIVDSQRLQTSRGSKTVNRSFFKSTITPFSEPQEQNPDMMNRHEIIEHLKSDIIGFNLFISLKKIPLFYQVYQNINDPTYEIQLNSRIIAILAIFFSGAECEQNLKESKDLIAKLRLTMDSMKKERSLGSLLEKIIE